MAFKLNVEVLTVLLFFALNFSGPITGNYLIYTSCYVTLGHNESLCALLGTENDNNETDKLEKEVQPLAAKISATSTVIDTIFEPLLCFFLGSWSDRFGRKPVMLLSIAGYGTSHFIKGVVSAIPYISPWFMVLASVPTGMTGGLSATIAATICYIADTTQNKARGIKLYVFEGMIAFATVTATLTCAPALRALGYTAVYSIAFLCAVLAWVYVFFWLPESVQNPETENKFRSLFNFKLLGKTIRTLIKPRSYYGRSIVLGALVILGLGVFSFLGLSSVLYLYLRNKFSWSLEECTYFTCIMTVVSVVAGTITLTLCYKCLRFSEVGMLLLSCSASLSSYLFLGFAKNKFQIYLAKSFDSLNSTINPMIRTVLSKTVEAEDIGKIFSIVISIELIFGLIGNLTYTFIYNNTLITFPAAFHFFTAGVYAIDIIIVGVIMMLQRYRNKMIYAEVAKTS
ncbi:hypothetical protein FQR65_LT06318 [Abscondita terminalis]|nr:hypothetical protein FQR65_LT06318 [Abscondita terminalis]